MSTRRNKKHNSRDILCVRTLRRVLNLMNKNSFVISDTITLLQAYQHIYYCQGVYKYSCNKKHKIKYFTQIKISFERVFDKIAKNCTINDGGNYEAPADLAISFHKLTRGKIAYYCANYQDLHKNINPQAHKAAIAYGREMLNYYLLIKRPAFGSFVNFC